MKIEKLKIKEYKHWDLTLHHDQYYLGRCVLWCKRNEVTDLLDMTEEEREEFWLISRKIRGAVRGAFSPDLINYASFSNRTKHLHFHIIPRYKSKVVFGEIIFEDKNFGSSPFPYSTLKVDDALVEKIREILKQNLEKQDL